MPIEIKEMQRKSEVVHILTGFSFEKVYVEVPHNWPIAVIYFSRVSSMYFWNTEHYPVWSCEHQGCNCSRTLQGGKNSKKLV